MLVIAALALTCVIISVYSLSLANIVNSEGRQPTVVSVAVPGAVSQFLARDGDTVKAGQLLARLDTSAYEAEIAAAEAEIRDIQTQAGNLIQPMQLLPGMSGTLPKSVPDPVYIQVPVKEPQKTVIHLETQKPETKPLKKPGEPFKSASDARQIVQAEHDKAVKDLAGTTEKLAEAQKSRDALRPKITQAEADAVQAEKKAAEAPSLLESGAISAKRSQELVDEKAAATKAFEGIKGQIVEADKVLAEAQAAQESAKANLDKTTAALRSADDLLAKSNTEPPKFEQPPVAKPKPPPLPAQTPKMETKIVMRRMPLVARQEEAPPIPMKVFVDEKAMKTSQIRIQDLQKKIEDLKQRIAKSEVIAPVAGILHISKSGAISIVTSTSDR
jgi:hypothetical protein